MNHKFEFCKAKITPLAQKSSIVPLNICQKGINRPQEKIFSLQFEEFNFDEKTSNLRTH